MKSMIFSDMVYFISDVFTFDFIERDKESDLFNPISSVALYHETKEEAVSALEMFFKEVSAEFIIYESDLKEYYKNSGASVNQTKYHISRKTQNYRNWVSKLLDRQYSKEFGLKLDLPSFVQWCDCLVSPKSQVIELESLPYVGGSHSSYGAWWNIETNIAKLLSFKTVVYNGYAYKKRLCKRLTEQLIPFEVKPNWINDSDSYGHMYVCSENKLAIVLPTWAREESQARIIGEINARIDVLSAVKS